MAKKLLLLLLAFALLLPLAGCGGVEGGTTVGGTSCADKNEDDFLDMFLSHRPTLADMYKVKVGMSLREIIDILGKPHYAPGTSAYLSFTWYTLEGTAWSIGAQVPEEPLQNESEADHWFLQSSCIWVRPWGIPWHGNDTFLDVTQSHKPTAAQMKRVRAGMKYADAIALIGSPHACEMVENDYWFYWFTDSGEKYGIQFVFHENEPMSAEDTYTMSAYFSHAYIRDDPKVMQ